ncbi:MAG: response regulator [Candidatus Zixiibacteriota bacterium]|jgi:signal transduction histidine kinase/FixJ family two-component response regulator/putative methionine-R-sulfoxide reductase with GAF domain
MTTASEHIFIIDDEQRMCDSLSALLSGDGYRVRTFQNSPEAVETLKSEKVDLVITDIKMPDMDGLEILNAVKAIDEDIPVILMTGYGSLDTAIEAISKGAYDYLLKPVEFTYLELAVRRALDKRRAELARLRLLEELKLSNLILQRRVGELNALYEAGKSIGSSLNLGELLRQLVVLASTVTEAQVGSIMLLDEQKQYLTIEASIGLDKDIVKTTRLPIGASIAGYVAKTGEALIVKDVEADPRFQRINRERYGAASLLCTPLKIKNDILGVINMANKEDGASFTEDDLRLLTTFASQAAVAVDDAYQFEKSMRRLIEFEILQELSHEMANIQNWVDFRDSLTEKLMRIFPVDYGVWFTWNQATGTLTPDGALGRTGIPLTESGKIDLKKISRASISLTDLELDKIDPKDVRALSAYVGEAIRANKNYPEPKEAYMAVPILKGGDLAYVFYLGADSDRAYTDDDISLARLVISQAALLFEKETALLNATRLLTMGNMISEISHDLRKPLTSIHGSLQILKQRWPAETENSNIFGIVEEEIHRLNELVRELVDFSNPNRYETTKVDLRQIVQRALDLVGPDLRKHNIESECSFDELNWDVIVNKNQIMEIFLNLMINAVDAMPGGGKLTVKGRIEKPPHRNDEYLAVKIIDTGVGIKRENLSKIFDRYYTTKDSGTGLGLAVVERVISAHNGTLHVESNEGSGTIFSIYLPQSL